MPTTTNTNATTGSRSIYDKKAQTRSELFEEVKPIVIDYVSSSRNKCWAMVEAAYIVKARLGEGPHTLREAIEIFRDCIKSAYQSSIANFTEDYTYINDLKLVEKCVKIAYAFSEEQLAQKRDHKTFNEVYTEVPQNGPKKKGKKHSVSKISAELKAAGVPGSVVADVREGMPVNGIETTMPRKETKSWVAPEVSGKRTVKSYGDDDWRKESIDIIADQFEERFLPMIKQALEKELVGSKRQQLKELIQ